MTGPKAKKPATASTAPVMPALKLLTSISKPGLIRPSQRPSRRFMTSAANGPMIMAPRNIGTAVPTMTPMVATTPTTLPRMPCTIRPPWPAMSSGSMYVIIGLTRPMFSSPALSRPKPPMPATGVQPVSMKNAVMRPQAMNAAMLGMIIPDRNVPNFCTPTRVRDVPPDAVVAGAVTAAGLSGDVRGSVGGARAGLGPAGGVRGGRQDGEGRLRARS